MLKLVGISGNELRKALTEVEEAEAAGFLASEACFRLIPKNSLWADGTFLDISEKAHPTDGRLNWGRDNFIVKRGGRFVDGKIVYSEKEREA